MPYSQTILRASSVARFDVVAGTGGHLLEEDFFGAATAHESGETGFEVVLGDGVLVFLGEVDGNTEGHTAGDDGDLMKRIRVLAEGGDEGVTGLVVGGDLLFFIREQHGLAFGAHHDLVLGNFKVVHVDGLAVVAGGGQGSFVHHIGEVRAGEAWCPTSKDVEVDVFRHGDLFRVDAKHFLTTADVGTIDD